MAARGNGIPDDVDNGYFSQNFCDFQHSPNQALLITLTVNGTIRQFPLPLSCTALITALELAGKRVALERNGEIVPRGRHAEQQLADGDIIEIVVAVGGG